MEAPRSRRLSPLHPGGGSGGTCPRRPSPTKAPLLPQAFLDDHKAMGVANSYAVDKKSGRVIQVTLVLLPAIMAGTLLFTILLSLKAHYNQAALQDQSLGTNIITPSSGYTGRMNTATGDLLGKQHFLLQAEANSRNSGVKESKGNNHTEGLNNGLLADFSQYEAPDKCLSRGHRSTKYTPTPYLIQRLRGYEALHRKCAHHAKSFVSDVLQKKVPLADHGDCRFVVWIAYSGLGNRLLSLVSAFLYALLTNRVLLVDRSTDMSELFCEPFAGTSWLVPPAFSQKWLAGLDETSDHRFGRQFNTSAPSPTWSYIHLTHTYNLDDRMFFCDQAQDYLHPIPWLFMRANNYIVPGLYFVSYFRPQLDDLFSNKETVFHLLGRYLFHPSNVVWGWISRFRKTYLASSGRQVGVQIRSFNDTHQAYFQEQLARCALENKVLPNLTAMEESQFRAGERSDVGEPGELNSILVTSLQPEYYEKIRDFYLSAPTEDGRFVAVHQPSHEGWQKTGTFGHDLKAWADIYLLSFSDDLITSGWSTFGYSAQALAGVKPWILFRSFDYTVPNPPCAYARSIEPCFHTPPLMDCKKTGIPRNPAKLLPFVQKCEDVPWGIKLIEPAAVAR